MTSGSSVLNCRIGQCIDGAQAVEIDSAQLSNIAKPQEFTAALRGFLGACGVQDRVARQVVAQ